MANIFNQNPYLAENNKNKKSYPAVPKTGIIEKANSFLRGDFLQPAIKSVGGFIKDAWNQSGPGKISPVAPTTSTPKQSVTPTSPTPQVQPKTSMNQVKPMVAPAITESNNQMIQPVTETNKQESYSPINPIANQELINAEKERSNAEKIYQDSLKIGADELSTQEDLDKLIDSAKQGFQNTKGQTIPMEFITGQLKSVEERANLLKEPLERKLARLQAARTSSLEASKFALERADKKLTEVKGGPQTKEVSSGATLTRWNPDTQKYEDVYTAPSKQTGEDFTLSEGQTRYDAYGNPIATATKKTSTAEDKQTQYSVERADRTISLVDEALKKVSPWTTGYGAFAAVLPESESRDFARVVDSIKANIGFNELQAMRQASPTGGALGQVAVQELNMLQSVLASLDTKQKPETVKANLEKIKQHFNNWKATLSGSDQNTGENSIVQTSVGPINTNW